MKDTNCSTQDKNMDIFENYWKGITFGLTENQEEEGISITFGYRKNINVLRVFAFFGPIITCNPFSVTKMKHIEFKEINGKVRITSYSSFDFSFGEKKYAICVLDPQNKKLQEFLKNKKVLYRFCEEQEKFENFEKEITKSGFYLVVSE